MNFNYISKFKILDNFDIEIEFDDNQIYIFKGVLDIAINTNKDGVLNYWVTDYFTYKITQKKPIIENVFACKYSNEFINTNINWKMNLLQIEWEITIYAIYEELVIK